MKKVIFEGEEIIKTWQGCTLTNKRVWRHTELGGQSEYRGFPLSQFQGAMIGKSSYPWLMYIGCAICGLSIFTFLGNGENKVATFMSVFFVGSLFLLAWHLTKRAQVHFCSGEVKINVHLHADEEAYSAAVSFVSDVEMVATSSRAKAASAA